MAPSTLINTAGNRRKANSAVNPVTGHAHSLTTKWSLLKTLDALIAQQLKVCPYVPFRTEVLCGIGAVYHQSFASVVLLPDSVLQFFYSPVVWTGFVPFHGCTRAFDPLAHLC